ncbi:MAG: hypothetical protein HC828_19525 [Blastochloris sp.]|nr:hypothetical protein [Blastochloris sp.]
MINIVVILNTAGLKRGFIYQLNLYTSLFLSVACLLASGSFASVGGLAIAVFITKIFERRGLKLLGVLLLAGVVAAILLYPIISTRFEYQFGDAGGGTPQTLEYRFHLWETVFFPALLKNNNFVLGITPYLSGGVFSWAWTENMYLFLLVRSGLVSLIGHLLWVGMSVVWLYRFIRKGQGLQRTLAVILFSLFITLTIMGMTNEVFTNSGSIDFFWMYMGLVAKGGSSYVQPGSNRSRRMGTFREAHSPVRQAPERPRLQHSLSEVQAPAVRALQVPGAGAEDAV